MTWSIYIASAPRTWDLEPSSCNLCFPLGCESTGPFRGKWGLVPCPHRSKSSAFHFQYLLSESFWPFYNFNNIKTLISLHLQSVTLHCFISDLQISSCLEGVLMAFKSLYIKGKPWDEEGSFLSHWNVNNGYPKHPPMQEDGITKETSKAPLNSLQIQTR